MSRSSQTLSGTSLPSRFTRIDETNRGDHYYLTEEDRCVFFGEWFAGKGYEGGPTNQLVVNFKHKPSKARAKSGIQYYKDQAITTIAAGLRGAIAQSSVESYTWVPIPPSKISTHEDYDTRLAQALNRAFSPYNVDIRSLIRQTESTESDHTSSGDRLSPENLLAILEVDNAELSKAPIKENGIVLFDDVLTTGKHFKCCQAVLRQAIPDVPVIGVFVARCIHQEPEFDDLDEVDFTKLFG